MHRRDIDRPLHFWVQLISSVLTACVIREVLVKEGRWPGKEKKNSHTGKTFVWVIFGLYLTISVSSSSRRLIPSMEICSSNTSRRAGRPPSEWLLPVWHVHVASRNFTLLLFSKSNPSAFYVSSCILQKSRSQTAGCCSSVLGFHYWLRRK